MKYTVKDIARVFAIAFLLFSFGCAKQAENTQSLSNSQAFVPANTAIQPTPAPTSLMPNLQAPLLDDRFRTTKSPLGTFDFKNFSYPLPRGWQNPDNSDAMLTNGTLQPVFEAVHDEMDDEEKAAARSARRIGMSYVTTRYMDVTGDGQDDAFVILKVETTGSAIPQFVYIYDWKNDKPELIWYFRTGDRADGGLKDFRIENGNLVVELYGEDRFLLGGIETSKITDDEEQLCCPTYFTRTFYKWNGKTFQMNGKRLTYSVADPSAPPVENMAEIVNAKEKAKK
jgi:hypothetical protein